MEITIRLFASLRLEARAETLRLDLPPGSTVSDALDLVRRKHSDIASLLPACRVAIGVDFAEPSTLLKEGDDVALIPPVQGGCAGKKPPYRTVILTDKPVGEVLAEVLRLNRVGSQVGGGAVVEFWGIVRPTEDGDPISGIEYEAYAEMAEHQLHVILEELESGFPLLGEVVIHRTGLVPVGEPSLYVRVEAPHRQEAFTACQSFIEKLKTDVPIWKHPVPAR